MTNIFEQFAQQVEEVEADPCAHCGGDHLNQDCKTPREGFYVDPATGDTYEASIYGYYEMIHSTNYGDVRGVVDSQAFKFAERPDLIPKEQAIEANAQPVDNISDEEYIDLAGTVHQCGLSTAWLMGQLQVLGVDVDENPPGVFAPKEIPRSAFDAIRREIGDGKYAPPILDAKAFAKGLKAELDRALMAGISQNIFQAHTRTLIAENGKTKLCLDFIAERLDLLTAQKLFQDNAIDSTYVLEVAPIPCATEIKARMMGVEAEVNEDGEVINLQEVYEALGFEDKRVLEKLGIVQAEQFQIKDNATADWFVSRIRAMQDRCDRIAEMAAAGIAEQLRFMSGMLYRYGGELKDYSAKQIPLKKDGTYRQKNVKYTEGAVHFRKGGGWKITDYPALQAWADSLPGYQHKYREALEKILEVSEGGIAKIAEEALAWESPIDAFPITVVRKVDKKQAVKFASQGVTIPGITQSEVRELQVMSIGGQRAWSILKLKDALKLNTEKYKLLSVAEDDDAGGAPRHDEDDLDPDTD